MPPGRLAALGATLAFHHGLLMLGCAIPLSAQWTNRYQRIGRGHHVYVEGYDFPTYSAGPTYPAVSPDGSTIAFSARGWLWTMSADGGPARRLTNGAGMDSRPAWHPGGERIAFVRDNTRNTDIVEVNVATGAETVVVAGPAAELDPAYAPDGTALYYASAEAGDLEIYRLDLRSGERIRVTDARGLDLRPQPLADGSVVHVSKRGSGDEVAVMDATGVRRVLALASIASLARPAISPDGRRVVVPLPVSSRTEWALQLMDVAGGPLTEIVSGGGHPIMPAWSSTAVIYFSRARHITPGRGPGSLRCSSLTYSRYARSSRLASRAPRSGTYATHHGSRGLERSRRT